MHGPFNLTIFAYIIELYRNLPLAGDRERNNCVFLTQQEVGCIDNSRYLTPWKREAGIAPLLLHLHSKCSVYLYRFQTNSCWSNGSQTSARWQRAATSLLLDRWCARKRPAYAKCLHVQRGGAGPITGVYVSEMLNRSHLSERCNRGEDERRFVRERNRPADKVFEMRPSRCGNKIKLERQQSMKRLSPNFQDADVIVLAVALFQLAAVPWTKAFLPHVFLYKPRFSFMEAGCSWLELFSTVWDDTEHLLFMYQSQIQHKDLSLFSRPQSQGRWKAGPGRRWLSTKIFSFHTLLPFIGRVSVFQTCQESGSDALTPRTGTYSQAAG